MITGTPGAAVFSCPISSCDWTHESRPPGPEETPGALADVFGLGVFAAHARMERLQLDEESLRAHLGSHDLAEWVRALVAANDKLSALRRCAEAPTTTQDIRQAMLLLLDGAP